MGTILGGLALVAVAGWLGLRIGYKAGRSEAFYISKRYVQGIQNSISFRLYRLLRPDSRTDDFFADEAAAEKSQAEHAPEIAILKELNERAEELVAEFERAEKGTWAQWRAEQTAREGQEQAKEAAFSTTPTAASRRSR